MEKEADDELAELRRQNMEMKNKFGEAYQEKWAAEDNLKRLRAEAESLGEAVREERELCARIADRLAEEMRKEIADYPGLDHEASSATLMAAEYLAKAIRKGEE
jgi:predicted nuclease with TOPRIM domain